MDAHRNDDSVLRELRRFELARRLIFHEVRTETMSQLTGLSRNRLATLRRRLRVSPSDRHRGPAPCSIDVLLRTSRGRTEGAALVALFLFFKSPKPSTGLDEGEQACALYEAYLAYYPQSSVRFEELMLLKRSFAEGSLVELALCRVCKGLMIFNRHDGGGRICTHCEGLREPERASQTHMDTAPPLAGY
jgi:hypothetical protein